MKTIKWIVVLSTIVVLCLIACQKENLFSEQLNLEVTPGNQPPPPTILTSPATIKWLKKKADRKMSEILDIVKQYYNIPSGSLLEMAAYCNNRIEIAHLTGIDYDLLTLATEMEDLKRIGIDNEKAAILQGALYFRLYNAGVESDYSLDIEEVSKHDVSEVAFWIQSFIEVNCTDCSPQNMPEWNEVASWIEKAEQLPLKVSYPDSQNKCHYGNGSYEVEVAPSSTKWIKKKADRWDYPENNSNINPNIMISPAATKWVKKKADRKMEEVTDVVEQYYNIPAGGLLEMSAYCTNRIEIANYTDINYDLLTLATEFQDIQRIGLSNEQAAILIGALFFGGKDSNGQRDESLDIEELKRQLPSRLLDHIVSFVLNHCEDCNGNEVPSIQKVNNWIQLANELPLLVSYPDEELKCYYGNGDYNVDIQPAATKWIKKKADRA